jgi:hypothetical protein
MTQEQLKARVNALEIAATEVVAELRERAQSALSQSSRLYVDACADLVAEKLCVTDPPNEVMSEFKGTIVEGAYYERNDGQVVGPSKAGVGDVFTIGEDDYYADGESYFSEGIWLTRRVYITHADPAEVVAELTKLARKGTNIGFESAAYDRAADLVTEKLVGGK